MAPGADDAERRSPAPKRRGVSAKVLDVLTFAVPLLVIVSAISYTAGLKRWFPFSYLQLARQGYGHLEIKLGWKLPWFYPRVGTVHLVTIHQPGRMAPGLTLVSGLGPGYFADARVVDAQGRVVQQWDLDWFKLWPKPDHLPSWAVIKGPPGPLTHGIVLADNGDLIFNFERGGLMRVDACGRVRWKLAHMTSHAVFRDEDGNLWVPDETWAPMRDPDLPAFRGPIEDDYLLKITPEGRILKRWRMFDLLRQNNLLGLLYLDTHNANFAVGVPDPLHLNDVDIFPRSMPPGRFRPGDVMVSLRNINMVIVFDPETDLIRHIFQGVFVRQHDPDFVDGNSISLFDNASQTANTPGQRSRIVELHADGRPPRIVFEGTKSHPFFSYIMGRHQALSNGNMLLAETTNGRALEVDPRGKPVWEWRNIYDKDHVGLLSEAERLDPAKDAAFFARARARCRGKTS